MSLLDRAEKALRVHFDQAVGLGAPPRLVEAMRHAVFSGAHSASALFECGHGLWRRPTQFIGRGGGIA